MRVRQRRLAAGGWLLALLPSSQLPPQPAASLPSRHEFVPHNTEDTMVEDAHVNHVPVLTDGVGKAALRELKGFTPK